MSTKKKLLSFVSAHKAMIFPVMLLFVVLLLSTFRISGTSMGVYDYMFGMTHDNLVAGQPRTVRSDEWTVNTPYVISQYGQGMKMVNSDVGQGQDMSVVVDVPYLDWSILFRPQNLAFFVLPLEIAFAFKWWFLGALLAFAVYCFVLLLYPKRYLLASLAGIFFLFSPFIQWWYQSITLLPIAYALLLVVVFFRLIQAESISRALAYTAALAYLLICFVLIMYPAFQITVALVAVVISIVLLTARRQWGFIRRRRNLVLIISALAISGIVVGIFIMQHIDIIKTTLNTIYPGSRNVTSGGSSPFALATWPLSYLLLDSQMAGIFQSNQSEASNFLLFGYAIAPVLFYQVFHKRRSRVSALDKKLLIGILVLSLVFLIRMFIPVGSELFGLIGLSKVPHVRLFIGFGIMNLTLLVIAVLRPSQRIPAGKRWILSEHWLPLLGYGLFYGLGILALRHHFVITSMGLWETSAVIIVLTFITTLFLSPFSKLRYIGLGLATLFAMASAGLANPLYRGLELPANPAVSYVSAKEKTDSRYWISNDSPYLSSVLLASSAEHYGGVNTYPQLELWKKHFPDDSFVFNRYAHIRFTIDNSLERPSLSLVQADSFRVTLPSCSPLLRDLKIGYIVSETDLGDNLSCYPGKTAHMFGKKPVYIYQSGD